MSQLYVTLFKDGRVNFPKGNKMMKITTVGLLRCSAFWLLLGKLPYHSVKNILITIQKRRNIGTKIDIYKISQSWDFITRVPP